MAPELRQRERKETSLAGGGEEGEGGRSKGEPAAHKAAERSEPGADESGGGKGAEGEVGEGEALTSSAPAHVGSEGFHHGEASGRPGAGDPGDEGGRGDGETD